MWKRQCWKWVENMENNVEVQVTVSFDIDAENAKELEGMDHLSDEIKRECMAGAMEGVVKTVLNKHFENDERVDVIFVGAEPIPQ
jgi:hypothetical protein